MPHNWKEKTRPLRLERRLDLPTYELNRDFLDRLGELSEKRNRFPDISFGKTYVNLTLRADDDDSCLSESDIKFASEIDALLDK